MGRGSTLHTTMPAFCPAAQIGCNPTSRREFTPALNFLLLMTRSHRVNLLARGCWRSLAITTIESINASRSINQLLLAGEKRMASRTNFYVQIALFGRTRLKRFAARACHSDFSIFRMNSRFHFAITLLLTFPLLSQTGNDTGRLCGRSSRLLMRARIEMGARPRLAATDGSCILTLPRKS